MFSLVCISGALLYLGLHIGVVDCKIPLYVAALQEWSNWPSFYRFPRQFEKVVSYALAEINNHSEVLADYELMFEYRDTKVGMVLWVLLVK